MFDFRRNLRLALLAAVALLALPALASASPGTDNPMIPRSGGITMPGPVTLPGPETSPNIRRIVLLARRELARNVFERRGDNVPRYRRGRGRIAPYSIGDQWCAAFATWIWHRAGFRDYLGTNILWRAFDGTQVAVQVRDLTNWAIRNGHFSYRARPGYLVAYGVNHIGIVERIDRVSGRAVASIEGNIRNRLARVRVPMRRVTGYISPVQLTPAQLRKSAVHADMRVPAATRSRLSLP